MECLKQYDGLQLGLGSEKIPQQGRSNQAAQNSGAKSQGSLHSKPQSRCSRLLHHTSCIVHWLARYGNSSIELRRHFPRRRCLFTSGQERQRRQEKAGIFQRLFQTPLQRIHSLEAKRWRTCRARRPSDSIQQHQKLYDNTGDRKSLQEDSNKGWLAFLLFHPLLKAYLCLPSLQSKRLQPASGSETVGAFELQNYGSLCRCDEPRFEQVTGEAFYLRRLQIEYFKNQ